MDEIFLTPAMGTVCFKPGPSRTEPFVVFHDSLVAFLPRGAWLYSETSFVNPALRWLNRLNDFSAERFVKLRGLRRAGRR